MSKKIYVMQSLVFGGVVLSVDRMIVTENPRRARRIERRWRRKAWRSVADGFDASITRVPAIVRPVFDAEDAYVNRNLETGSSWLGI